MKTPPLTRYIEITIHHEYRPAVIKISFVLINRVLRQQALFQLMGFVMFTQIGPCFFIIWFYLAFLFEFLYFYIDSIPWILPSFFIWPHIMHKSLTSILKPFINQGSNQIFEISSISPSLTSNTFPPKSKFPTTIQIQIRAWEQPLKGINIQYALYITLSPGLRR